MGGCVHVLKKLGIAVHFLYNHEALCIIFTY